MHYFIKKIYIIFLKYLKNYVNYLYKLWRLFKIDRKNANKRDCKSKENLKNGWKGLRIKEITQKEGRKVFIKIEVNQIKEKIFKIKRELKMFGKDLTIANWMHRNLKKKNKNCK